MSKNSVAINKIIWRAVCEWCSNETDLLGIEEWEECYDDYPTYSLSEYNLFDITDSIVDALIKHNKRKRYITFCDCDITNFKNEYSEEDILNNVPEIKRKLKTEHNPSLMTEYDYSNIHIFEVADKLTPILPETAKELAVIDIYELVDEWVELYVEEHEEDRDEMMEEREREMSTDIDDYDEDGAEYDYDDEEYDD